MDKTVDLPPAYFSLMGSEKTINLTEEKTNDKIPICDDNNLVENSFENNSNRSAFIQKVLLIKLLQLIGAIIIAYCSIVIPELELFILDSHNWVVYISVATAAYIALYGLLMFCDKARQKNPYKYMFLVALPALFAIFIGLLFGHREYMSLVITVWANYGTAIFAMLAYSIFAMNTKAEFVTGYSILIAICGQVAMFAVSLPLYGWNAFYVLYPSAIMTLHYIYMICNIHAMTTNNYHTSMTSDDYVDGVINLYLDYVYFFSSRILPKLRQLWMNFLN